MIIDRIPFRSGEEFRTLYDPLLPQSFTEDRTETEEGPYAVTLNEWRYTLYSVHPVCLGMGKGYGARNDCCLKR